MSGLHLWVSPQRPVGLLNDKARREVPRRYDRLQPFIQECRYIGCLTPLREANKGEVVTPHPVFSNLYVPEGVFGLGLSPPPLASRIELCPLIQILWTLPS